MSDRTLKSWPDPGGAWLADGAAAPLRVLEAVETGILTTDERGAVELFNPAAERLFGYTQAEIGGRNVALLLAEPGGDAGRPDGEDRPGFLSVLTAEAAGAPPDWSAREGGPWEAGDGFAPTRGARRILARRRDESTFPARLAVSEVRLGDRRCFVGAVTDLSEWRAAEERLRATEAAIQDAFDSLEVGIALWTGDGRLVLANDAFRALHPLIAGDLRPGARVADLARLHFERGALATELTAEQWVAARLRAWRSGGMPYDEHRSDGRVVRVEDSPTRGGNIVSTCRDVTELHRAERRLPGAAGEAADGRWSWARSSRFIFTASTVLWALLAAVLMLVL